MSEQDYKHLLLALDFAPDAEPVLARALRLRGQYAARLSLVHVLDYVPHSVELMPMSYTGDLMLPEDFDLENRLIEVSRAQMDEIGERIGVPPEDRHIQIGPVGHAIQATAEELGADLVILGSHGRHGLKALLGSTVKSVVQGLTCDLLCVRIGDGT